METLETTDEKQIDKLAEKLHKGEKLRARLPGLGKINIEKPLPFLLVYRHQDPSNDPGTARFLLSEASYLIIDEQHFDWYRQLLLKLADTIAAVHQSVLILELWAGEPGSHTFRIKGPANRIPSTIKVLKEEVLHIDQFYNLLNLKCEVEDTIERHPPHKPDLLSITDMKNTGSLLIGLEVPPVYRSQDAELYPVFFRSFHERLLKALHLCFFDFIRVQTSCQIANYTALGRSTIDENARKIDDKLCSIEHMYQFLWLVSPSNIREIKHTFFKSNYEKVPDYHYRLLPVDPDLLKRELYNLEIDEIKDPSLAFLFRDKREELDLQISMLNERGTPNFFYNSMRLYKGVPKSLREKAEEIMQKVSEQDPAEDEPVLNAHQFAHMAEEEFERFRGQDPGFASKVHVRDDVNVMMVSRGELYLPSDYKMSLSEAEGLLQHEVGIHVLTYHNGRQQILRQLSYGLAGYDALQEGLAVMAEYLVGGLTANRLRTLAARVLAASARVNGAEFREIFDMLHKEYGMGAERAFNVTSRIFQGGGFLKDVIYLQGLVELRQHLREGGELKPLLMGKIAVKHIGVIKTLRDRGLLKEPTILPSYLEKPETEKRLQKIREGLPLYEMINA